MFGKFFFKTKKQVEVRAGAAAEVAVVSSEMKYCPACGDEYRAEQILCAACDLKLISGTEKLNEIRKKEQLLASRSMQISSGDEMVTLRKGALHDIKHLQRLLAKERIPSVLLGDEQSCAKGCCGTQMNLQVRKNDVESAMAVVNHDFVKTTALENHDMTHVEAVYVQGAELSVCPACGCQFSPDSEENCPECGLCFV